MTSNHVLHIFFSTPENEHVIIIRWLDGLRETSFLRRLHTYTRI